MALLVEGAFHRNSASGGAAKGTPLKICISPSLFVVPETRPVLVLTISRLLDGEVNDAKPNINKSENANNCLDVIIVVFYYDLFFAPNFCNSIELCCVAHLYSTNA